MKIPSTFTTGRILLWGLPLVMACWSIYGWLGLGRPVEKWGVFGDKFGALSCLFSGFGFVVIVATIRYQHEENAKKEDDTINLIERFERTATALEHQAATTQQSRYLNALVARIEGYNTQFGVYHANTPQVNQLKDEQDLLLWELQNALNKFRAEAGGVVVTKGERARRLAS